MATRKFQSIFNFLPKEEVLSQESEVIKDESMTISQIISLHLRGIPANVHIYDSVQYEHGDMFYNDEVNNNDYYELENDLSDYNSLVPTSGDNLRVHSTSQQQADPDVPQGERAREQSPSSPSAAQQHSEVVGND